MTKRHLFAVAVIMLLAGVWAEESHGGEPFAIVVGVDGEKLEDEFAGAATVPGEPPEYGPIDKNYQIAASRLEAALEASRRRMMAAVPVTNEDVQREADDVMKGLEPKARRDYQRYKLFVETHNAVIADGADEVKLMEDPRLVERFPMPEDRHRFIALERQRNPKAMPLMPYEGFLAQARAEFLKIPNRQKIQQELLAAQLASQTPWGDEAARAKLRARLQKLPGWRVRVVYAPDGGKTMMSVPRWLFPWRLAGWNACIDNLFLLSVMKHIDDKGEFTKIAIPGTAVSIVYDRERREPNLEDEDASESVELSEKAAINMVANARLLERFLEEKPFSCTDAAYERFLKDGGWLFAYAVCSLVYARPASALKPKE